MFDQSTGGHEHAFESKSKKTELKLFLCNVHYQDVSTLY